MSYNELIINVRNKLKSLPVISVNYIQQRYHVLQSDARKAIQQLQAEGRIGRTWDPALGGYPVIKE